MVRVGGLHRAKLALLDVIIPNWKAMAVGLKQINKSVLITKSRPETDK